MVLTPRVVAGTLSPAMTKPAPTGGHILLDAPRAWRDIVDRRFGRLVALGYSGRKNVHGQKYVECMCDCGNYCLQMPSSLRAGAVQSCGCLRSEHVSQWNVERTKHGHARGGTITPEYRAWTAMIRRCTDPKSQAYADYGGRGIQVCERWLNSFEAFFADVGSRPSRAHSLDRIDNDGNYEPANVRWALPKEQVRNKRQTPQYTYRGESLPLGAWADRFGLAYDRVYDRLRNGWSLDEALNTPVTSPSREVTDDLLYGRWWQMIYRCHDPRSERYADYGGRGIRVCERWRNSFEAFKADVGPPPSPQHVTLDRIDNNGHYEPGNVQWATYTEQTRNRRTTKRYALEGFPDRRLTLVEWAELAGLDAPTIKRRLRGGWPLDEALGTPKGFGRCALHERRKWIPER